MTPFPRPDYAALRRYDPERAPVPLDLSDNTNLWGTHPDALARIRGASNDDLARYPELYADELREAVSERFEVPVECVTTGAGSDDLLDSAFRAAWRPGGVVAFPAPTFSMIEPFALMNGLGPSPVPWDRAAEDPELLLHEDPALVYVCRPDNPSGRFEPVGWVDALLEARGPDGPLVVIDEAYADFARESLLGAAPDRPNLLVTRTASKAYGLAGLRCGFAVGTPDVALGVDKSRGPYKVSGLAAAATAAAVRDACGWLERVLGECLAGRDRLFGALTDRGHLALPSRANFILVRAPGGDARADALALRGAGIGVRPFSGVPGIGEGLRVTVGPARMMDEFLRAFDDLFPPTDVSEARP